MTFSKGRDGNRRSHGPRLRLVRRTSSEDKPMAEGSTPIAGPLLTVAEIAEVLRVSNMTVYRLIKAGELPALRVGKNYHIREADLSTFLAEGAVAAEQANG